MTTVFAEALKQWDKIIIPATSQTSRKEYRVNEVPQLTDLTVKFGAYPILKGHISGQFTTLEFGRKVELEIERD